MSTKLRIKARDAVNDVRSGMSDSEMMDKYGLSAKGLHSLFMKLVEAKAISQSELDERSTSQRDTIERQIDSRDMIDDVRSGMSDSELMTKYALSSEGLRTAVQKMIESNVITVDDLSDSSPPQHDTVFVENMREAPRYHLAVDVVIYGLKNPEIRGSLVNVGENGLGIRGIESRVGETKTFIIPTSGFSLAFSPIDPVRFDAKCKWAKRDPITRQWHAGFEITDISTKCRDDLERLIQSASFPG